ncbi:MAG: hypothetical protein RIC55_17520 [Pirellulaceae bacterium]
MPTVAQQMADNAKQAMKLTRKYFVVELNYSEESLEELERVIDDFRIDMPDGDKPETVDLLMRLWGGYLGEVIRRHLDGAWINADEEAEDAVDESAAMTLGGRELQPLAHMRRRLEEGAEHNVWEYYRSLRGA